MRWAKAGLRFVLTVLVTWFIFRALGVSLEELKGYGPGALNPRWGLLCLATVTLLLAYLFSAALWGLMVREMGGPELPTPTALRVFFTANLGRYLPGKVWQVAGLAYLARGEGVSAGTATGAAILGQAFSLVGATLVGAGVLLRNGGVVGAGGGWVAAGVLVLLAVATFPALLRPLLARVLGRGEGTTYPGPLWPDQAFGVRWVGLYAVSWVLQGGAFWLLALGLGVGLAGIQGLAVFPAAYLLGYIAVFAPAGVGVREGALVFLLAGAPGPAATLVALVARLWTTVVELGVAAILGVGYLKRLPGGEEAGGDVA